MKGSVSRIGAQSMFARHDRPDDRTRRTDQEREPRLASGTPPVRERGWLPSGSQVCLTVLLLGVVFSVLAPVSSATGRLDATNQNRRVRLVGAAQAAGAHPAHSETQTAHARPLIEQVVFNQKAVSFDQGVTAGPGAGNLKIQFAPPASGASDHLQYRLVGVDKEWKEAGKERAAVYNDLAPGRYEFDFETAGSSSLKGPVEQSIPITVLEPNSLTGWFRSLCIILLLLLILVLHKLRVRYLVRHAKKLEEAVNQTKAQLTLAAEMAGDAQEALKEQALKDGLTGLWNRRAITAMLEREVYRAQRDRFPITLLMIDMDHFKNINDTHGHLTGDEVLREAAGRLLGAMRPYDFAGRYGGEEFLVVLPSCAPHNGMQRAEELRCAIAERPIPTALGPLAVTCSLGVAAYDGAMRPEDLIHLADEALYRAKRQGRNCVCSGNQAEGARAGTVIRPEPGKWARTAKPTRR